MSNSEDKVQKTNGLGTDPLQRLASLKTPRDLSLGGIKPNRKIFTPNLNITRNKSKGPTTVNLRDQKKDDKGKRDKRNDRHKNFNKNGPKIIKSSGVFSEGLGSAERQSSRFSYGRDGDSTPTLQKPTIRVKDFVRIDKELEDQKIKSLYDSNVDDEMHEEFKYTDDKDVPIKLPMDNGCSIKSMPAVKVKQEMEVKREPKDDIDSAITTVEQKPILDVKKEVFEDTDVVNILKNEKPTLILLQLPDSLPGRGGSVDDEPRRKNEAPSTSTAEGEGKPVDNRCRIADLEEGKVGKLRIHRSGRVSLVLGDTIFEVCSGTKPAFHQEVVSLAVDDASRSANLVGLGGIQHKLNLVPDWETMFNKMIV